MSERNNDGFLVVGAGIESHSLFEKVKHLMHNDITIIDSDNVKEQLPFPKSEPLIIQNRYPIETMTGDFVCKGKHQYRDKNGIWICQCGRKIND